MNFKKIAAITCIAMIVPFALFFGWLVVMSTPGLLFLPEGECLRAVKSPSGRYSAIVYRCDGDATVDFAVRVAVKDNYAIWPARNVYWEYHQSDATVKWLNDTTIKIDNKVLNVLNQQYDFRQH